MTNKQKEELFNLTNSSRITQVIRFAKDKEYDLDLVQGLMVSYLTNEILNSKLNLDDLK